MPRHCPPHTRPRRFPGSFLVLVLALVACGGEEGATALTADEFIEVIVELREAERAVAEEDSAAEMFATRKAEILERHGTTEEEIQAFTGAASRDLQEVKDIWEEISTRLRRPARPDSAEDRTPPSVTDSISGPDGDSATSPSTDPAPPPVR